MAKVKMGMSFHESKNKGHQQCGLQV